MKWILIAIIAALVIAIIGMAIAWPKVIEISDDQPKSNLRKDAWLRFQNEGAEYITYKDGKIFLKIVK